MTTNAQKLYTEAKQTCLNLGIEPTFKSTRRLVKTGGSAIKNAKNYFSRRDVTQIKDKPYTNEFGDQEPFGSICERNLSYAEDFVAKNMKKFQGGVQNMTDASMLVMQYQRKEIDRLKSDS
jgi:hypothetical protein